MLNFAKPLTDIYNRTNLQDVLDSMISNIDVYLANPGSLIFNNTATGLTWTSATNTLSLTSGYVIPTTTEETHWNTAYSNTHVHNQLSALETSGSPTFVTLNLSNSLKIFSPTYPTKYTQLSYDTNANLTYVLPAGYPSDSDHSTLLSSVAGVLSFGICPRASTADDSDKVDGYHLNQGVTTLNSPTFANITDSGLTSGRVPYASTAGLLVDSVNLLYNGSYLSVLGGGTGKVMAGAWDASNAYSCISLNGSMSSTNYNFLSSIGGSGTGLTINRPLNGGIGFRENHVEQMTLVAGGQFGIGVTSPTAKFQVVQGTTGWGTVSVGAGGTVWTGSNTKFLDTFKVGDTITSEGQTKTISLISSNTSLTTNAVGAAISGKAYTLTGATLFSVYGNGIMAIPTLITAGILHNAVTTGIISSSLIVNADITANTIQYGSIQQVSETSRVLGRISSGAGNIEELDGDDIKTIIGSIPLSQLETQADNTVVGNYSGASAVPTALDGSALRKLIGATEVEGIVINTTGARNGYTVALFGSAGQTPQASGSGGFVWVSGVSGSFVAGTKTITVTGGIITAIV